MIVSVLEEIVLIKECKAMAVVGGSDFGGPIEGPGRPEGASSPTGKDTQGRKVKVEGDEDARASELFEERVLTGSEVRAPQKQYTPQEMAYKGLVAIAEDYVKDIIDLKDQIHQKQERLGDTVSVFDKDPRQQDKLLSERQKKLASFSGERKLALNSSFERLNEEVEDVCWFERAQNKIGEGLDLLDLINKEPEKTLKYVHRSQLMIFDLLRLGLPSAASLFFQALPGSFKAHLEIPPMSGIEGSKRPAKKSSEATTTSPTSILGKKGQSPDRKAAFGDELKVEVKEIDPEGKSKPEGVQRERDSRAYKRGCMRLQKMHNDSDDVSVSKAIQKCLNWLKTNSATLIRTPSDASLDSQIKLIMDHPSLNEECKELFFRSLPDEIRKRILPPEHPWLGDS